MTEMSEMSGMDSSVAEPPRAEQDGGDNRKIFAVVLLFLALFGVIAVVYHVMSGSPLASAGDTTVERESTGVGSYVKAPDVGTSSQPPPKTTGTTTTTTTKTTTTSAPCQLICTVGPMATLPQSYPTDSLCQCLFYTHVVVLSDKVIPIGTSMSYTVFKQAVANYKVTEGGLSLDMRSVNPGDLVRTAFQDLLSDEKRNKRIYHLGSLNIQYHTGDMQEKLDTAEKMLQQFKTIQLSHANIKTVLALGTFGYSSTATWNTFKDLVKRAAAKNFGADTVILISSYSSLENISETCIMVPPTALETTSAGQDFPSLNRLGELVKRSYTDNNQDVYMGLSLEMGAMVYQAPDRKMTVEQQYMDCTGAELTSTESVCDRERVDPNSKTQSEMTIIRGPINRVVHWDSLATIRNKLKAVKAWPPRRKFAWLLFNVPLIDPKQQCKTDTQDRIIAEVKSLFPYTA